MPMRILKKSIPYVRFDLRANSTSSRFVSSSFTRSILSAHPYSFLAHTSSVMCTHVSDKGRDGGEEGGCIGGFKGGGG